MSFGEAGPQRRGAEQAAPQYGDEILGQSCAAYLRHPERVNDVGASLGMVHPSEMWRCWRRRGAGKAAASVEDPAGGGGESGWSGLVDPATREGEEEEDSCLARLQVQAPPIEPSAGWLWSSRNGRWLMAVRTEWGGLAHFLFRSPTFAKGPTFAKFWSIIRNFESNALRKRRADDGDGSPKEN
ncbi:hypothetical protein DFH08DRAFT_818973 [Mycena albidolilacea]|uniref:Uncharacterized protein n=1 Tax=Mycena albidolilacea TaxID=1033008 RepID=A0AAD7EGN7_9AGAR|nr:hypothetical protein DFH08DRAFT_818973 [Mycena albidolilacea]